MYLVSKVEKSTRKWARSGPRIRRAQYHENNPPRSDSKYPSLVRSGVQQNRSFFQVRHSCLENREIIITSIETNSWKLYHKWEITQINLPTNSLFLYLEHSAILEECVGLYSCGDTPMYLNACGNERLTRIPETFKVWLYTTPETRK